MGRICNTMGANVLASQLKGIHPDRSDSPARNEWVEI
jgi:hypothetical protein